MKCGNSVKCKIVSYNLHHTICMQVCKIYVVLPSHLSSAFCDQKVIKYFVIFQSVRES